MADYLGDLGARAASETIRLLRQQLADANERVRRASEMRVVYLERQVEEAKEQWAREEKRNRVLWTWRSLAIALLSGDDEAKQVLGEELGLQECGKHGWWSMAETPEAKDGCLECREEDERSQRWFDRVDENDYSETDDAEEEEVQF